jgi:hypothetical protein
MRVKGNNSNRAEALAVMHDKALDLGFTANKLPPNWITENKTPNWDWLLHVHVCPPWLKPIEYQRVFYEWANEFNLNSYFSQALSHADDDITGALSNLIRSRISNLIRSRIIDYIRFHLYTTAPADHDYPSDSTYAKVRYKEAISDLCFRLDQISPWKLR